MLLDQATPDLLGQVGQRQRRECGPGGDPDAVIAPDRVGVPDIGELAARDIEEQPTSLVPEPVDQGGRDRWLAPREPGEAPEDVCDHLAEKRTIGREDAAGIPVEPAIARDQKGKEEAGMSMAAPDGVELRRGVEARLVWLDDPEEAVAVEVPVLLQPAVVRGDAPLLRRVAHGDAPGPGEQRRLDRRGVAGAPRGDVVGPAPLPVHRAVPEDRVAYEPVGPASIEQAAELPLRPVRIEA